MEGMTNKGHEADGEKCTVMVMYVRGPSRASKDSACTSRGSKSGGQR